MKMTSQPAGDFPNSAKNKKEKKKNKKKISEATQGPSFVFVKWMKHDLAGNPWEHYFPHWATKRICGFLNLRSTRCLKITEKVSFNIASEASCVYILSGQKLVKNAKNDSIWRVFENLKLAVKHC